jgi:type VI secretion system protein VasG
MADISLETVAGKLNRVGYEAFFQALRQAKRAGNRHVELAHWLGHILQNERTDIGLTADHFNLDRGKLLADVAAVVGGFRTNETEMPAVSNTIIDVLDRGWHYATLLFGEAQIRTGHVLVGALQSRELARAFTALSPEFAKIPSRRSRASTARSGAAPRRRGSVRWTAHSRRLRPRRARVIRRPRALPRSIASPRI